MQNPTKVLHTLLTSLPLEMLNMESKLKFKDLLLCLADGEIAMEKQRQILAVIKEFEPYSAFKRIDRENKSFITNKQLRAFLKENGYKEYSKDDLNFLI